VEIDFNAAEALDSFREIFILIICSNPNLKKSATIAITSIKVTVFLAQLFQIIYSDSLS